MTQIIPNETYFEIDEAELCFSDDEDGERVDKMLSLIKEGSSFRNEMFEGEHQRKT